ncbi:MAG: NADH-quinone oxidoreductase subunit C [Candidatus Sumerlaeia bacterium]
MTALEIYEALKTALGETAILKFDGENFDPFVVIAPGALRSVMQRLRDDPRLAFDYLVLVTAVDYPADDRIQVVYHLYSYVHYHKIVIKTDLPRQTPEIASVADIYPAADWHEREQFDLMGVVFTGHPNLRRILCVEDWEGHPLRKDYKEPESYHGIPTSAPPAGKND